MMESLQNYIHDYPNSLLERSAVADFAVRFPFTQMRFYCHANFPNRTFHIRTLNVNSGPLVAQYFHGSTSTPPVACGSFERYPDDNSILAGRCYSWGPSGTNANENSAYGDGTGSSTELLEKLIFITDWYYFSFNVENQNDLCDNNSNNEGQGEWKIFVR